MPRLQYIDVAKGFAIFAMIIGHMEWPPNWLIYFVFSWHIPLFFLVSGYTFRPKSMKEVLWGSFQRLVLPYWVVSLVLAIRLYISMDASVVGDTLLSAFYGHPISTRNVIFLSHVNGVGAIWFLLAMFWCRVFFNALVHFRYKYFFAVCIAIIATVCYAYGPALPFSFLQGLSALTFFSLGYLAKEKRETIHNLRNYLFPIGIVGWVFQMAHPMISMAECSYVCYPLDVAGACFATWCVLQVSRFVLKFPNVARIMLWIGLNSLLVLCLHNLECHALSYGRFGIAQDSFTLMLIRIGIVAVGAWFLSQIKVVRKIFGGRLFCNISVDNN